MEPSGILRAGAPAKPRPTCAEGGGGPVMQRAGCRVRSGWGCGRQLPACGRPAGPAARTDGAPSCGKAMALLCPDGGVGSTSPDPRATGEARPRPPVGGCLRAPAPPGLRLPGRLERPAPRSLPARRAGVDSGGHGARSGSGLVPACLSHFLRINFGLKKADRSLCSFDAHSGRKNPWKI